MVPDADGHACSGARAGVSEAFLDVWRQADRFQGFGFDLAAGDRPIQGVLRVVSQFEFSGIR